MNNEQVGPLQQRVDAEGKLRKQQEHLRDAEQTIPYLEKVIAELRKKTSPRIQPMGEEMSSANDEEESSDDLSRGLGCWLKLVNFKKRRF